MGAQKIAINLPALKAHTQKVKEVSSSLEDMKPFGLSYSQGAHKEQVVSLEEDMSTITSLSRELLEGYIGVVQAAHGEYAGSDSELAAQFNRIEQV